MISLKLVFFDSSMYVVVVIKFYYMGHYMQAACGTGGCTNIWALSCISLNFFTLCSFLEQKAVKISPKSFLLLVNIYGFYQPCCLSFYAELLDVLNMARK